MCPEEDLGATSQKLCTSALASGLPDTPLRARLRPTFLGFFWGGGYGTALSVGGWACLNLKNASGKVYHVIGLWWRVMQMHRALCLAGFQARTIEGRLFANKPFC